MQRNHIHLFEGETSMTTEDEEFNRMERDRHPMFSDGYDHALQHIAQFVRGRGNA